MYRIIPTHCRYSLHCYVTIESIQHSVAIPDSRAGDTAVTTTVASTISTASAVTTVCSTMSPITTSVSPRTESPNVSVSYF